MKKMWLMLALASGVVFNSYGFGIGVQGNGGMTKAFGGDDANRAFYANHRPFGIMEVGLTLSAGSIEDPSVDWRISYRFGNRAAMLNAEVAKWGLDSNLFDVLDLGISTSLDFNVARHTFKDILQLYVAVGFGLDLGAAWDTYNKGADTDSADILVADVGVTLRVPLGMRVLIKDHLDVFIEVIPAIGAGFGGGYTDALGQIGNVNVGADVGIQESWWTVALITNVTGTVGLRYWF